MLHTIILLIICFITVHMYILSLYDRYQKKKLDSAWIKDLVRHGEEWGEYDDVAASEIDDRAKTDPPVHQGLNYSVEEFKEMRDVVNEFGIMQFCDCEEGAEMYQLSHTCDCTCNCMWCVYNRPKPIEKDGYTQYECTKCKRIKDLYEIKYGNKFSEFMNCSIFDVDDENEWDQHIIDARGYKW